jgi:hypothetical protein
MRQTGQQILYGNIWGSVLRGGPRTRRNFPHYQRDQRGRPRLPGSLPSSPASTSSPSRHTPPASPACRSPRYRRQGNHSSPPHELASTAAAWLALTVPASRADSVWKRSRSPPLRAVPVPREPSCKPSATGTQETTLTASPEGGCAPCPVWDGCLSAPISAVATEEKVFVDPPLQ